MERRVTPPKRVTSPTRGPPPPCKQALNRLDLTRLKRITGWTALVDFPTRGDSFLDNCFTISQISSEKRIL